MIHTKFGIFDVMPFLIVVECSEEYLFMLKYYFQLSFIDALRGSSLLNNFLRVMAVPKGTPDDLFNS